MDDLVRERLEEQRPVHDDQFARTIQFFIAVRIGHIAKVRAYLDHDPALLNMHERWDEATALRYGLPIVSSFTPLHRAAYNGDRALVAFLLGRHADVNARTRSGQTPLHVAVMINYPAVVAQLLDGAADPNRATDEGLTPLHYAVILDRPELALLLLDAGAGCRIADRNGRTPLDWAVVKGYEHMVMLLRARQLV
jgi:ankyrin repeat protein